MSSMSTHYVRCDKSNQNEWKYDTYNKETQISYNTSYLILKSCLGPKNNKLPNRLEPRTYIEMRDYKTKVECKQICHNSAHCQSNWEVRRLK